MIDKMKAIRTNTLIRKSRISGNARKYILSNLSSLKFYDNKSSCLGFIKCMSKIKILIKNTKNILKANTAIFEKSPW